MKLKIKKTGLYYLVLVLAALIFLFANYPRLFGVDAFQVMWMANALKEGALFSDNTWLIHPTSYFGYYPFSFRAIGVPMLLAILMSLLEFLSFGIFGLTEAVLLFNIILIYIIYKTSRKLGETLFQEEWSRIVFVAAMLLSVNFINDYVITVSTRIIISIAMLILLNLSLKFLEKGFKLKLKTILFVIIVLVISSLAHRLWVNLIITLIFVIFTLIIRKYEKIHYLSVFLIFPLAIVAFFFGFEYFGLERYGFSADANFLELSLFLGPYYMYAIGLIVIFFPLGVVIAVYDLTFSFDDFHLFYAKKATHPIVSSKDSNLRDKLYYLLLLLIPFFFFIFTTYYAVVIFLPIIIIFSVQGLIYIKNYLSSITIFSKKIDWAFPILTTSILICIIIILDFYLKLALTGILLLALLSFVLFSLIFLFNNFKRVNISFSKNNFLKLKNFLWTVLLSLSILTSSVIMTEFPKSYVSNNPYPWDNLYLTDEEDQIIQYFKEQNISGLIFVGEPHIADRLAGVGFLPAFSDSTCIGTPLFYGIISPNYVIDNTKFLGWDFLKFTFFYFTQTDPIRELKNEIKDLDLRVESDHDTFLSYHIQYIISINETFQSGGINDWLLIQSLTQFELYEPSFTTYHLLVWKIY